MSIQCNALNGWASSVKGDFQIPLPEVLQNSVQMGCMLSGTSSRHHM